MKKTLIAAIVLSGMVVFFIVMALQQSISVIETTLFTVAIIAVAIATLDKSKEKYSKKEEEDYLERRRRDQEARSLAGVPYLLM